MTAITDSGTVLVVQVGNERETHWREGVSMVYLSFISNRYATQGGLNKVGVKSNATPLSSHCCHRERDQPKFLQNITEHKDLAVAKVVGGCCQLRTTFLPLLSSGERLLPKFLRTKGRRRYS